MISMKMKLESIILLTLVFASLAAAFIVPIPSPSTSKYFGSLQRQVSVVLHAQGSGYIVRPPNEFSRKYNVESILGGGPRQRDYKTTIEAKEEERNNLASRFELSNIDRLQAELTLRKEGRMGGSTRGEF